VSLSAASSSQINIVIDKRRTSSLDHFDMISGNQWEFLKGKILRAGLKLDQIKVVPLGAPIPADALIVGLGEDTLRHYTDKKGIDKWQLSPLTTLDGQKFIPTYDLGRTQKQYELGIYLELAFRRAKEEASSRTYERAPECFNLNPSIEETLDVLRRIEHEPEIACDVETGYGQINTVGFAWSASDAIAINVLPDRCGSVAYKELWTAISRVLSGPSRKIFQNFIYDVSYFSAYGIRTENVSFDTMWAMKFLWPEFKSNLGNVGRIYTKRPYWKDDGKATDEESAKRDWGNIRDWEKHYLYNCRDTTGTFEAKGSQEADLRNRGLLEMFSGYVMRLHEPILEMCTRGMPVDVGIRERLRGETEAKIAELKTEFSALAGEVNPRSPKQLTAYIKGKGIALPKKFDRTSGNYKESTDASSIKKLRLKHPEMRELALLQEIKSYDTSLSRYINFDMRPDGRLSYSLNGCGTETLRFSGNKDAWDRGFNIQTIPREGGDVSIKQMFVAPDGWSFVEVDLRQAESRFVAYDSADKTLIEMLESGADVHTYVGRAILKQMGRDPDAVPPDEFKATWRQLGKKAGHGLNYYMKANVFVETVFNELDIVISKKDAELITQAYYGLFPGIPRWHQSIKSELYNKRKLSVPSGWERYFYSRWGDDLLKEAYAFRPQHTIPWITNHLMLHLWDERKRGNLKVHFLVQVHDSLILLVPDAEIEKLSITCHALGNWHPSITLPGGKLVIPIDFKVGKTMSNLSEYTEETT
jgi:DNA polymerase I-like protein with 3'-5' exonuclease and polymerase domains